jgi:prepilin-type N-terminal cleavage/methylation domain-containing protein
MPSAEPTAGRVGLADPHSHATRSHADDRSSTGHAAQPHAVGFTLVEVIIATTIASLLMAIALPVWRDMRERSYVTAMQADLRNLAVIQESHFYDKTAYTPNLAILEAMGFQSSPGVRVTIHEATRIGWSATLSHGATLRQCHLFVGTAAPVGSATEAGAVDCG